MKVELVKESPELIRDGYNRALLNKDNKALAEYKIKRDMKKSQKNNILQCQDDINTLKNEIKEIKNMFNQILSKL